MRWVVRRVWRRLLRTWYGEVREVHQFEVGVLTRNESFGHSFLHLSRGDWFAMDTKQWPEKTPSAGSISIALKNLP